MKNFEALLLNHIVGHKITLIRPMLPEESKTEGWEPHNPALHVIILDNDCKLYSPQPILGDFNGKSFNI